MPSRRWVTTLVAAALVAVGAGCSTDPGNQYGGGGSTGSIQVRDSLIGSKTGSSPFTVSVDTATRPLTPGGVTSFTGLVPGGYAVNIGALGNCSVAGGTSQAVQVYAGYVQYLTFVTTCQ